MKTILLTLLAGVALLARPVGANVRPAALFSDHMVMQAGRPVPVWGTAAPGEKVAVAINGQTQTATAGADGRWMVHLSPLKAGGPYTATVSGQNKITIADVLVGEVWLASGQSNMDFTVARTEKKYFAGTLNEAEEIKAANYPQIRMFTVDLHMVDTPQDDVTGHWAVCSPATVGDFSAVGYFFARDLFQHLHRPVGVITSTFGASTAEAWTSREALVAVPDVKYLVDDYDKAHAAFTPEQKTAYEAAQAKWRASADAAKASGAKAPRAPRNPDPTQNQHNATVLYNGMIHPVKPYALRGAIWYQGESNGPTADKYFTLMKTLITDWRQQWGEGDFPFLSVQLANINAPQTTPNASNRGVARVREGQLETLRLPRTGMATAVDIGEEKNVHPKNKQEVGRRLALWARVQTYGEKVEYSGPLFDRLEIAGSAARLHFTHTSGGLVAKGEGGKLTGFTVAGADGKWQWADARIDGDTVIVSSPQVPVPVAVRYAWADNPPVSLYNGTSLPASPFRTDNDTTFAGAKR